MQFSTKHELNSAIVFLHTDHFPASTSGLDSDGFWTFPSARDPLVKRALESTSPPLATWRAEAERAMRESKRDLKREDIVADAAAVRPAVAAVTSPVVVAPAAAPLEFKKVPVRHVPLEAQRGGLALELLSAKREGSVVGSGGAGSSVKLKIFLPDRMPFEIRVSKTATVEETIRATIERCMKKGARSEQYELRMHDSDGLPDEDFPALDRSSVISEVGDLLFCLCPVNRMGDTADDVEEQAHTPVAAPFALDPPSLARTRSVGAPGENIRIMLLDRTFKTRKIDDNTTVVDFLSAFIKRNRLPLFADEYQLQVTAEDQKRLHMLSPVIEGPTLIKSLGVQTLELHRRRFADAPPDTEMVVDQVKREVESSSRAVANKPSATMVSAPTTPDDPISKKVASSRKKEVQSGGTRFVDPESILLNEIKAAMYQEWIVTKTNKWNKTQKRVLGVDLQKIYNKSVAEKSGLGHLPGQSVKRPVVLITDVTEIDLDKANPPCGFYIVHKDGPNGLNKLSYEAATPEDAAQIVAKIRYIQAGSLRR